jgi:hypothetical protein
LGRVFKKTLFLALVSSVINFLRPIALLFLKPHPEKVQMLLQVFLMDEAIKEKKLTSLALPGAMQL